MRGRPLGIWTFANASDGCASLADEQRRWMSPWARETGPATMPVLLDHRQHHRAGRLRRAVDALGGFHVVRGVGFPNVGDVFLRVAVVDREPRALHLHHEIGR